jgi:hypothetical protein
MHETGQRYTVNRDIGCARSSLPLDDDGVQVDDPLGHCLLEENFVRTINYHSLLRMFFWVGIRRAVDGSLNVLDLILNTRYGQGD